MCSRPGFTKEYPRCPRTSLPCPALIQEVLADPDLAIPKLRQGSFFPSLLSPRKRVDKALYAVICSAWIEGVSTRKVDDLVRALGNESGISRSTVSRICKDIDEAVGEFLARPLEHTWFPYLFVDATYVDVRVNHRVVSQALVVATGVSAQGRREILGMAVGDAETTDFWTSFLRSLRERGLRVTTDQDPEGVVLVTSDAHAGIRSAVKAILPGAAWQRCTAFAALPKQHWPKIWSNNPIERLNREVKRRADVVQVFPDRQSVTRLIGAVLLEQHEEWQYGERRYLSEASLRNLTHTLSHDQHALTDHSTIILNP